MLSKPIKWQKRALFAVVFLGVVLMGLLSKLLPQVGSGPTDEELLEYASSKNFDSKRGTFVNRRHDEYEQTMQKEADIKAGEPQKIYEVTQ